MSRAIQSHFSYRLLNDLHRWLMELSIPRDCFELMYRLGQKTLHFQNVNVEFFAPYLLKDGLVQKVTRRQDKNKPAETEVSTEEEEESEAYEEEDLCRDPPAGSGSEMDEPEEEEEEEDYEVKISFDEQHWFVNERYSSKRASSKIDKKYSRNHCRLLSLEHNLFDAEIIYILVFKI